MPMLYEFARELQVYKLNRLKLILHLGHQSSKPCICKLQLHGHVRKLDQSLSLNLVELGDLEAAEQKPRLLYGSCNLELLARKSRNSELVARSSKEGCGSGKCCCLCASVHASVHASHKMYASVLDATAASAAEVQLFMNWICHSDCGISLNLLRAASHDWHCDSRAWMTVSFSVQLIMRIW